MTSKTRTNLRTTVLTTVAAARAAAAGIADWSRHELSVRSLQEILSGEQLQFPL